MKPIIVVARFFLGLIFHTFGLNGFLNFIPSLSAIRNGGPVRRRAFLRLPLSGPDISAPDHFGSSAPAQSLCPARTDAACSDHRQHPAHSHSDASERSASGDRRDRALDCRVFERPFRFRRSLAGAHSSSGRSINKPGEFYAQDCHYHWKHPTGPQRRGGG